MEPKNTPTNFDKAIETFLNHIESLWTSLPYILTTIENANQSAIDKFDSFIQNNCEFIPEKNHYIIKAEDARKHHLLKRDTRNTNIAHKIVKRNFLISLVSQFDTYIASLLKCVFETKPEILDASEKKLSFSELMDFGTLADVKEFIIEKEIEAVLRGSHTEQFRWFENRLKLELTKDLTNWKTFIELTQRRNLYVHNDGRVSTQYVNVCKENKCDLDPDLKIGDELEMNLEYFNKAFTCLFEIGFKLNQVIRRKLIPSNLDTADHSFLSISLELILNKQYELSKEMHDFADKYIKKYSNDDIKLRIVLNRAQTYKWLQKEEKCMEIVNSIDWSACGDLFKMAAYVLRNDFTNARECMISIGDNSKLIGKADYALWPIFKEFRKSNEFKTAHSEIYKIEFEIIEEKGE